MDREAWQATVHSVANTKIKLSMHAPTLMLFYGSCIGIFVFSVSSLSRVQTPGSRMKKEDCGLSARMGFVEVAGKVICHRLPLEQ